VRSPLPHHLYLWNDLVEPIQMRRLRACIPQSHVFWLFIIYYLLFIILNCFVTLDLNGYDFFALTMTEVTDI